MTSKISSRYFEKIAELKHNIKTRTTDIVEFTDWEKACCYFCGKPIRGRIRAVKEIDSKGEIYYSIDQKCYAEIIGIKVIK